MYHHPRQPWDSRFYLNTQHMKVCVRRMFDSLSADLPSEQRESSKVRVRGIFVCNQRIPYLLMHYSKMFIYFYSNLMHVLFSAYLLLLKSTMLFYLRMIACSAALAFSRRRGMVLCDTLWISYCVMWLCAAQTCGRKRVTDPRESPFAVIFLKTPAMAATQLGFTHGAITRETSVTIVAIARSLNFNVHMLWNLSNLHQCAII